MYRRELSRMEAAMNEQLAWLKDWHIKVLGSDAAQAQAIVPSPFKAWYYGLPSDLYEDSPVFAALGFSLESMQSQAEQTAAAARSGKGFPTADYASFMDSVGKFTEMVFKLMREAMGAIAFIDDVTGVGNEAGMRIAIAGELERVRRTDQRACVAVCEIADYQLVGAGADDAAYKLNRAEVLAGFAGALSALLRPYDQLFRAGAERFLVSLPYTEANVAESVVNRLNSSLVGGKIALIDGTNIDVGLHWGIASIEPDDEVNTVAEHAIEALSQAQEPGRRSIVTYQR
jgi:diguanylate cyclase (GGDEF)-like protein